MFCFRVNFLTLTKLVIVTVNNGEVTSLGDERLKNNEKCFSRDTGIPGALVYVPCKSKKRVISLITRALRKRDDIIQWEQQKSFPKFWNGFKV